jgi:chemotaxis signal transduction protein
VEGLCHLRAEFLPVLRLEVLVNQEESSAARSPSQVVVMTGAGGPWGISVDQVVALEPLEVVINFDDHERSSVVMGSANYRDQVVRVLNHTSLIRRAQEVLKKYWEDRKTVLCG